jgi:hypothetical protein
MRDKPLYAYTHDQFQVDDRSPPTTSHHCSPNPASSASFSPVYIPPRTLIIIEYIPQLLAAYNL